jgi:hypothetical protein
MLFPEPVFTEEKAMVNFGSTCEKAWKLAHPLKTTRPKIIEIRCIFLFIVYPFLL